MGELTCKKCEAKWDGKRVPTCPNCQASYWNSLPTMIVDKHDPRQLPSASSAFRSTLPSDFPQRANDYYLYFAHSGTALYHQDKNDYCYVAGVPTHLNAGSAVPPGSAMPTRPMDSFVVPKAFGSGAHVYSDDVTRIQGMISDGPYQWLPTCSSENCENLCVPGTQFCAKHTSPPLAD